MAIKKQATLPGFNRTFELHPNCKPYTLRDNGFENTKGGNFMYKRPMDSESRHGFVLKVTVDKAMTGLSISTVSHNGLKNIQVMDLANNAMIVEKINFIFDGFVDRGVMIEITDGVDTSEETSVQPGNDTIEGE